MATSRDDQSARVTKKNLKDDSVCAVHRHNKKGINKADSPISPPRRERPRFSSICPSTQAQPHGILSDSARTCHRVSRNQRRNMLPHRCLVEVFRSEVARVLRALFFSRMSFWVMCFWSHSVRVSKCLILPTPLLAPFHLLRKRHLPCEQPDIVPCLGTSSSGQ